MIDALKIEDITESDIQNLFVNSVSERMNLEFKRDVFGGNDEAKRELLKDISALANSIGGDLIIGIDAADGVAKSIIPITVTPSDKEILRIEGILRSCVQPRLRTHYRSQKVTVAAMQMAEKKVWAHLS